MIQVQQQFHTRNQTSDEDYMQYLDALEGLRIQGFRNEEVGVRGYEIMQKFVDGFLNFELKRFLGLMYAQDKYVEEPPTVEALRFTVQQYLRMRRSACTDHYQAAPQEPVPPRNQPNPVQQQTFPPAPMAYR